MVKLDAPPVTVVGVYPVEANQPVWLIEVELTTSFDSIDWGSITQPDANVDRSNWQTVYDEQVIEHGDSGKLRAVFFFHYLAVRCSFPVSLRRLAIPLGVAMSGPARPHSI